MIHQSILYMLNICKFGMIRAIMVMIVNWGKDKSYFSYLTSTLCNNDWANNIYTYSYLYRTKNDWYYQYYHIYNYTIITMLIPIIMRQ